MDELFTIGHNKKGLRDFVGRLRKAEVDCVVDVRLHNTSQLAGFAKKDDLEFLLTEGFGIKYFHMPDYAPTEEILSAYKKGGDWAAYEEQYGELMVERWMPYVLVRTIEQSKWAKPCLLCAEDKPDHCHRRLLAEAIQDQIPGLEVTHL
ncbi:MAG: DUF488 domain-containing protein [Armatimonadota bacterium]|nr:DUF488 domain-containing protein [bacterium]